MRWHEPDESTRFPGPTRRPCRMLSGYGRSTPNDRTLCLAWPAWRPRAIKTHRGATRPAVTQNRIGLCVPPTQRLVAFCRRWSHARPPQLSSDDFSRHICGGNIPDRWKLLTVHELPMGCDHWSITNVFPSTNPVHGEHLRVSQNHCRLSHRLQQ
jgi:hypothetical protein